MKAEAVELTDVTLRDGLQMEARPVDLERKLGLLTRLSRCGYGRIEITSFVNPKWVPQFSDAESFVAQAYATAPPVDGVEWMAFVPNEKGLERLLKHPIPWVSAFVAVSQALNRKNVNAEIADTLRGLEMVVKRAHAESRRVRIYVSTAFGCPYEGAVAPSRVAALIGHVAAMGPDEVALGDTIGVATPTQVRETLDAIGSRLPLEKLAVHFHNTYGLGIAASQAAFDAGVRKFDGSTGGIGGCPYAKGASGNMATDEWLYALYRQGAVARFPREEIAETLRYLREGLGLKVNSHLSEILEKGGVLYGIQ